MPFHSSTCPVLGTAAETSVRSLSVAFRLTVKLPLAKDASMPVPPTRAPCGPTGPMPLWTVRFTLSCEAEAATDPVANGVTLIVILMRPSPRMCLIHRSASPCLVPRLANTSGRSAFHSAPRSRSLVASG